MKYNNKVTRYGNQTYQSKLEADYAQQLDIMMKAGEIQDWNGQVRYRLEVEGKKICDIIPDFWVKTKHGAEEIHETKSWATQTPVWRVKWKLMQALYPEYKYVVVQRKDLAKWA